jgi:hypothetical protein
MLAHLLCVRACGVARRSPFQLHYAASYKDQKHTWVLAPIFALPVLTERAPDSSKTHNAMGVSSSRLSESESMSCEFLLPAQWAP